MTNPLATLQALLTANPTLTAMADLAACPRALDAALIAGARAFEEQRSRGTTPIAIVSALQIIAARMPADALVADAQELLTNMRCGWVRLLSPEASVALVERFAETRAEWIAFALEREAGAMTPEARAKASEVVQALLGERRGAEEREAAVASHALAALACSAAEELGSPGLLPVIQAAFSRAGEWRPWSLDALARAAERAGADGAWAAAVEALVRVVEDEDEGTARRQNAGMYALSVLDRTPDAPRRAKWLARVAFSVPQVEQHSGLRRALRHLGLASG